MGQRHEHLQGRSQYFIFPVTCERPREGDWSSAIYRIHCWSNMGMTWEPWTVGRFVFIIFLSYSKQIYTQTWLAWSKVWVHFPNSSWALDQLLSLQRGTRELFFGIVAAPGSGCAVRSRMSGLHMGSTHTSPRFKQKGCNNQRKYWKCLFYNRIYVRNVNLHCCELWWRISCLVTARCKIKFIVSCCS